MISLLGWYESARQKLTETVPPATETVVVRIPEAVSKDVSRRLVELNWNAEDMYQVAQKARQSTVCILPAPDGHCGAAGVVVGPNLVATCGHCAHGHKGKRETKKIYIRTLDGESMPARVVANHPNADLGLAKVTSNIDQLPPALTVGFASPGEPVLAIGNPSGVGTWAVVLGKVLSVNSWGEGGYMADFPTRPGMSGAPVVNRRGEVIGLVSGSTHDDLPDPFPFEVLTSFEQVGLEKATIESGTKLREFIERHR